MYAMRALTNKVRRVNIATHSAKIHKAIGLLFRGAGWERKASYDCGQSAQTPFGRINFQDGVQSWANPRLIRKRTGSPETLICRIRRALRLRT